MADVWNFLSRVRHHSVWRVLGLYAAASWVALEVVDVLAGNLGLPRWFFGLALGLLLLGVPIALAVGLGLGSKATSATPGKADTVGSRDDVGSSRPLWKTAAGVGVGALALWGAFAAAWVTFGIGALRVANASIAVLPFENLSGSESAYFANGVHEDLLTQLSKIGTMRVISRTSVLGYKPGERTAGEIGGELNVSAILRGSVQHDPLNNRVRLNVQLIDTATDSHLWADQYDRTLDDVFRIQSELALRIARELSATLRPEEERRIAEQPRPTTEAYDLILRGRELYGLGVQENAAAIRLFREAAEADSGSAEAWAELANAFSQQIQLGGAPREWADSAVMFAERAVELDPDLPLAHKALGMSYGYANRPGAEEEYRRALELSPNYMIPMINLSARLWNRGECDEGIRLALRAHQLSPLDPFPAGHMGDHNACLGRVTEFRKWISTSRQIEPNWIWADYFEGTYLLGLGSIEEADSIARAFVSRAPGEAVALLTASEAAIFAGDYERARIHAERILQIAPDWRFWGGHLRARANRFFALKGSGGQADRDDVVRAIAIAEAEEGIYDIKALPILHAVIGNTEEAIVWLERASELSGASGLATFERDPRLAAIRDDPRFVAAIEIGWEQVATRRANVEAWETQADPYTAVSNRSP